MEVARAVAPSLWHSTKRPVGRVPYGPAVPVPSTPADGCGCHPRTSTRRCKRRRPGRPRSEEHTSELQSRGHLVCRLLLEKKKKRQKQISATKKKKKTKKKK